MSWKTEHGPLYRVPGWVDGLVAKGVFEDASWHNDTMPRFGRKIDDRFVVDLWVDHVDPNKREAGAEAPRYMVTLSEDAATIVTMIETDDKAVALAVLRSALSPYVTF
ncbi:MAG: hypothetical protein A3E01_18585 [Gammaproteobacteria bacterium RIFCSPHIGHO2_12_FULL_63_22]|nr:MAG: hypothetical protein A3E01_18585 [Gammaproteobacteria bacterium RIFCSPHIGHO2_12_FULL_63_22]